MRLEIELFSAVDAGLSCAEWRVLMLMVWQMDANGYVYGVAEETSRATYYRSIKGLASKGLVRKVGRWWQVTPEFAVKLEDKRPVGRPRLSDGL